MSTSKFLGILCFSAALYAQLPRIDPRRMGPHDEFAPDASASAPLVPDWPEHPAAEPIAGVVSLRELQHPVSKKAIRAAFEAQQLSKAHDIPKAIAKLEKAIRIDPSYRDARAELHKALEIGPPASLLYADLALTSAAGGEFSQARGFAQKALELDPGNLAAQRVLQDFQH